MEGFTPRVFRQGLLVPLKFLLIVLMSSVSLCSIEAATSFSIFSERDEYVGQGINYRFTEPRYSFDARYSWRGVTVRCNEWYLEFRGPGGAPLQVGRYEGTRAVTDQPFSSTQQNNREPGLFIATSTRTPTSPTGSFEIKKIIYGERWEVIAFWATFVQRSQSTDGYTRELRGEIQFRTEDEGESLNQPPGVHAGDRQLYVDAAAPFLLRGFAADDNKPIAGALTCTWSVASGYGTVSFANPNALETTASFSSPGLYRLQLTASDGDFSSSSVTELFVYDSVVTSSLTIQGVPVTSGGSGTTTYSYGPRDGVYSVQTSPGKIRVSFDGNASDRPAWNLSFTVPANAPLAVRRYEIPADPTGSEFEQTSLEIARSGLSYPSRAGSFEIKQAVYNDKGEIIAFWATFERSALSGEPPISGEVKYFANLATPSVNQAPGVWAGAAQRVDIEAGALLKGIAADDGLPSAEAFTHTWSKLSGPGTVEFVDPAAFETRATFSAPGLYKLRLTASDGEHVRTSDVEVRVVDLSTGTRLIILGAGGSATTPALVYTELTGEFRVSRNWLGGVSVSYEGPSIDGWNIDFVAPAEAPLEAGRTYTGTGEYPFQASDSPGFRFSGRGTFHGGAGCEFTIQEIVYGDGNEILKFRASFIAGWFSGEIRFNSQPAATLPRGGVFQGLLESGSGPSRSARIVLGNNGSFTAAFRIGRRVVSFRGRFQADGTWSGSPPAAPSIDIALLLTEAGITGNVRAEEISDSYAIDLSRRWKPSKSVPHSPAAGTYTFLIRPNTTVLGEDMPQGISWGTLRVTNKGTVQLSGRLGDGERFSFGGQLSEAGHLGVNIPVYRGEGFLGGKVTFASDPLKLTDAAGMFLWAKPSRPLGDSFEANVEFVAGRFTSQSPTNEPLSGSSKPVTARLILSNKYDEPVAMGLLRLGPGNSVTVLRPLGNSLRMKILKQGAFSGIYNDPALGMVIKFSGAILQKWQEGHGYWSQGILSGAVKLELVDELSD